jgi:hypothetical protein
MLAMLTMAAMPRNPCDAGDGDDVDDSGASDDACRGLQRPHDGYGGRRAVHAFSQRPICRDADARAQPRKNQFTSCTSFPLTDRCAGFP